MFKSKMAFSVYVHLSSSALPGKILETIKLRVDSSEESKEGTNTVTVGQLAASVAL